MNTRKLNKTELAVYALLWGILFLTPLLSRYIHSTQNSQLAFEWVDVFFVWRKYALFFVVFLIHNFLLAPLLVYRQRRLLYFSLVSILLAGFVLYQCSNHHDMPGKGHRPDMEDHRMPQMEGEEMPPFFDDEWMDDEERPEPPRHEMKHFRDHEPPMPIGEHDIVAIIVLILMLGMNVGVKFYFKQKQDQKALADLQHQNLEQQLEYLKYQINPHFLMNTLNNIHALVDIDPEEAKETIVELSKMLRFVLYEGSKQKVPLDRELAFMQNYITLMKLRYTDRVDIKVSVPETIPNNEVPPLMFITFVENAFKHGVSYQQQSFIDISVSINDGQLHFNCRNSRIPKEEDKHGGVGLKNVKQRLELIYGNHYTLDIKDLPNEYSVALTLPLSYTPTLQNS